MVQNVVQDSVVNAQSEIDALKNIRTFSLLSIFGFAIDAVVGIFALLTLSKLLSSFLTPSTASTAAYNNLGTELMLGGLGITSAILMLASLVFLRRGYRVLKGISGEFASPYNGVNMIFIGLIIIVIGSIALVPVAIFLASPLALAFGIAAVLIVGSILSFIGEILALIVGPFRLETHFNKSTFRTAGILLIVGIFVPFVSIAGVVLIYAGANSLLKSKPAIL